MESVECSVSREKNDSREDADRSLKSPLRNSPSPRRNSPNSSRESASSPRNDCASPEPNCPICLEKSKNESFTDSCLHQFCFQCLLDWSKVKAECPLCKQGFKSIIHNVRSIEDYDQYHLRPVENHPWVNLINIDVGLVDVGTQRLQYRSALINRRLRERALSLQRQLLNLQQPADAIPAQRTRRHHRGFASEHFRRNVYVQDMWVDYVANVNGAIDIAPMDFRTRPEELQRLTPWLNRELLALATLTSASRIAHVLNLIISLVSCFHIRSPEFHQAIDSYFNPYTDHFIHEFYTFARSGYDTIGFDENAHYVPRNNMATEVVHGVSDSDDSDVIYLSSSNEQPSTDTLQAISGTVHDSAVAGPSRVSHIEELSDIASCVCNSSLSDSDSVNELPPTLRARNFSAQVHSQPGPSTQADDTDASDSCMIVGYVKPRHERTPEIITLTSDISEPEVGECRAEIIEDYPESDESIQLCSCENWLKPCSIHSTPLQESSGSEYLPSRGRPKKKKSKGKQQPTVKSRKKSSRGDKRAKPTKYSHKKRVQNTDHSHRSETSCEDCYGKRQKFSGKRRKRCPYSSSCSYSEHDSSSHSGYSSSSSSVSLSSSSSCSNSLCSEDECQDRKCNRTSKASKNRINSRDKKLSNDKKYKSKSKSVSFDTSYDVASGTSSSSKHKASKKIRSIVIRRSNTDNTEHQGSSKYVHRTKPKRKSNVKHSRSRENCNGRQSSEVWNIVKEEYPSTSSAVYHDYPHTSQSYRHESSANCTKISGRSTVKKESKRHEKKKEKRRTSSDAERVTYAKKKRKRIVSPESDSSDSD